MLGAYGNTGPARAFGVGNELQGFVMHDLVNLDDRIEGRSNWAFQMGDLADNEEGFACAPMQCSPVSTGAIDQCMKCCARRVARGF
jgi:hypothetical protein